MLRKIKNFCCHRDLPTWTCFICFIITILVMVTFGFNDFVKPCFVYPEEEYQMLESEAWRIIDEKTLNTEVKHTIEYNNNLESKDIEIKLQGENASVIITVDNYGEDTQTISVNRNYSNAGGYHFEMIFSLIIVILMFGAFSGILLFMFLLFVGIVCQKIDWVLRKFKHKK